jgi:hypothetical protein
MPIQFGLDADSKAQAESFAIDHNNMTLGPNADLYARANLWDATPYQQLLESLPDPYRPISIAADELMRMRPPVWPGGEAVQDPDKEWSGMPGFENEDQMPFRTILVHFRSQQDVDRFASLVGQRIIEGRKYLWFPEAEIDITSDRSYWPDVPDLHPVQGPLDDPADHEGDG